MADEKKSDYGSMYNSAVDTMKTELYAHRQRKFDAVNSMHTAASKLNKLSAHTDIIETVAKAADGYINTLKQLPGDLGKTALKYTRSEVLETLRQYGLDEEKIVDMVRSGNATQVLSTMATAFERKYTGQLTQHIYREAVKDVEGADRYTIEKEFAGRLKKDTGSTKPTEQVIKNLETLLTDEAERLLEVAPPMPKAA